MDEYFWPALYLPHSCQTPWKVTSLYAHARSACSTAKKIVYLYRLHSLWPKIINVRQLKGETDTHTDRHTERRGETEREREKERKRQTHIYTHTKGERQRQTKRRWPLSSLQLVKSWRWQWYWIQYWYISTAGPHLTCAPQNDITHLLKTGTET